MPADCNNNAVGCCSYIIRSSVFVGKKVYMLPAILVRRLNHNKRTAVTQCHRGVLGSAGELRIGILAIKSRIHQDWCFFLLESALARIAGIDIHTHHRDDFHSCAERVYNRRLQLFIQVILQRNHTICTDLESR